MLDKRGDRDKRIDRERDTLGTFVSFLMMIEISKLKSQQPLLMRLREKVLALEADAPTDETVVLFARRRFNNTNLSCIAEG